MNDTQRRRHLEGPHRAEADRELCIMADVCVCAFALAALAALLRPWL